MLLIFNQWRYLHNYFIHLQLQLTVQFQKNSEQISSLQDHKVKPRCAKVFVFVGIHTGEKKKHYKCKVLFPPIHSFLAMVYAGVLMKRVRVFMSSQLRRSSSTVAFVQHKQYSTAMEHWTSALASPGSLRGLGDHPTSPHVLFGFGECPSVPLSVSCGRAWGIQGTGFIDEGHSVPLQMEQEPDSHYWQ